MALAKKEMDLRQTKGLFLMRLLILAAMSILVQEARAIRSITPSRKAAKASVLPAPAVAAAPSSSPAPSSPAPVTPQPFPPPSSNGGLHLPRFVCLRSGKVNMHVGPGMNYLVVWMYTLPGLPVEVIAQFDTWRQIRDLDGATGWVHKSLLTSRHRNIYVLKDVEMYDQPDVKSRMTARLSRGLVGRLAQCDEGWCLVEMAKGRKKYRGWVERMYVWGLYDHETKIKT